MISSGSLGGGIGLRAWVLNATVPMSYARHDLLDRAFGRDRMRRQLGFDGPGVGLMTGVDVADFAARADAGAEAIATVGLGAPAWAAAPDGHLRRWRPGTINLVVTRSGALERCRAGQRRGDGDGSEGSGRWARSASKPRVRPATRSASSAEPDGDIEPLRRDRARPGAPGSRGPCTRRSVTAWHDMAVSVAARHGRTAM